MDLVAQFSDLKQEIIRKPKIDQILQSLFTISVMMIKVKNKI